jgi:hypothetical protein
MDIDENDILFTNSFISTPRQSVGIPDKLSGIEYNDEFKTYYKRQSRASGASDTGNENIVEGENNSNLVKRYIRQVNTFVSVDSRDRDKVVYPTPSNFKIFLGRTFYNTRSIRLASMEFPNTNAVINSTNNRIYWINEEDIIDDIIDPVTLTYPVYSVELRIGSYIASKLEDEIQGKMNLIKRRNKTGDYHYFDVNLDIETDVVSFTSLILTQLVGNPFATISGTGVINVDSPNHGYITGETIYFVGARQVAGIPSNLINGPQVITVINADLFQFEIQTKANSSDNGGGSNVKSGKLAPFQLLFGDYEKTVAPNIGYLYENSSEQVVTNIKSMNNIYQVQISVTGNHGMGVDNIGDVCTISSSSTTPNIDGSRVITSILSNTSFLVSVNAELTVPSFDIGQVVLATGTYDITSIENFKSKTTLVEMFTEHNYTHHNNGQSISFYNTVSQPSFNGENVIFSVISSTEMIVYGELLTGGSVNVVNEGDGGYTPMYSPLTTRYTPINAVSNGVLTTITAPNHGFIPGDKVKIYNVFTVPSIIDKTDGVQTVFTVPNSNTFTIAVETYSTNDLIGESFVGSSIVNMTFPGHGMNTITSITNYAAGYILVQTFLPHNLVTGSFVRIMETNTVPNVDDGEYLVDVISSDSFTIPYPVTLTVSGTYGIIGMSLDFSLYGATKIGGFLEENINNTKFTVREIIDENNFLFDIPNYYSTSYEVGGGSSLFINSLFHGFSGVQQNTKNGIIQRSISLEGENYALLVSPQLGTMLNTGNIKDIFARITLDQSPGAMVFNFLSNPKIFDTSPIDKLDELEFSMVNHDGDFYEFNDLDYSFVLEITEVLDTSENFNQSSKRGLTDTS